MIYQSLKNFMSTSQALEKLKFIFIVSKSNFLPFICLMLLKETEKLPICPRLKNIF